MSPTTSCRSLRIRGLSLTTQLSEIHEAGMKALTPRKRSLVARVAIYKADTTPDTLICSLAAQNDDVTGIVTFPSPNAKEMAKKNLIDEMGWTCDDHFDGMTVLQAPEAANLE